MIKNREIILGVKSRKVQCLGHIMRSDKCKIIQLVNQGAIDGISSRARNWTYDSRLLPIINNCYVFSWDGSAHGSPHRGQGSSSEQQQAGSGSPHPQLPDHLLLPPPSVPPPSVHVQVINTKIKLNFIHSFFHDTSI